jgi:KaiC/GvpD/RAD55 family RecA-like ATPase
MSASMKDRGTRRARPSSGIAKTLTGISGLGELTSGGLPRGRPTLVFCGGAGCGKTVLGLEFLVRGATQYGEAGAIFAFEERGDELAANVASFGFDLPKLIAQKQLFVDHVLIERSEIEEAVNEIRAMMTRLVDHLKMKGITALLTSAHGSGAVGEGPESDAGISSLIDTWIVLQSFEVAGERNRAISVRKSRGTAHSNQIREFIVSSRGLTSINTYRDAAGFVTGSAREAQQRHDAANGAKKPAGRPSPS